MGAAQMGYRPIVDFMFGAFTYVAAPEILMQSAQYYFIHGDQRSLPLVITGAVGSGFRLANEHTATVNSMMLQHPGIKVAFPSTPYDAKGLMKSAIRDNNPVVLMWHLGLMMEKGMIPEEEYVVPLGVADVKREGSDITVVATGLQVKNSLAVAEELAGKVNVEVIDPRSLEPLDMDAILKSLEKTNRLVVVDEDTERCGFGGEVMAQVVEKGFDLLDAPMARVCTANISVPGGLMEPLVVPSQEKISAAIQQVMES
jgi:pyruvate dehydrogenase E1 component beta subunit